MKTLKQVVKVAVGVAIILYALSYLGEHKRQTDQTKTTTPAPANSDNQTSPGRDDTGLGLNVLPGFAVQTFAKGLAGARALAFDPQGDLWVSRTSGGAVAELEIRDGQLSSQRDVLGNLRKPHGLVFKDSDLFVAEENRVFRVSLDDKTLSYHKIADLPTQGGGHFTRTLGIGSDGRLYVSIGSSCNVCNEADSRRAAVYSANSDGSDFKLFAQGLRNTVFFAWHPKSEQMWGTDMGRDLLGDNIPPDEINIIQEGKDYGWPTCYGKNTPDPFGKDCNNKTPAHVELQAHSSPLGLAFIPNSWPAEYQGDLLVAYHGSWNRSTKTGYKIVRIKLDNDGNPMGVEDFITGWLKPGGQVVGRPVDLKFDSKGVLYISDDDAGLIYQVTTAAGS